MGFPRMFSANADGAGLRVWEAGNRFPRFIWRDARTVVMWCCQPSHQERFYTFDIVSGRMLVPHRYRT